jgi:hypothetical protein
MGGIGGPFLLFSFIPEYLCNPDFVYSSTKFVVFLTYSIILIKNKLYLGINIVFTWYSTGRKSRYHEVNFLL